MSLLRIGIVRTDDRLMAQPNSPLDTEEHHHRLAHFEVLERLRRDGYYGASAVADDYRGNGIFARHWLPESSKELGYTQQGQIRLDLLFDRGPSPTADQDLHIPVINRSLHAFGHKDQMLRMFGDLHPPTIIINSNEELTDILRFGKPADYVVLKGFRGFGGEQVIIDRVGTILSGTTRLPAFPLLAQEFIETSDGIPGLTTQRHDLRVYMIEQEIVALSLRTPAAGKLLSNTKQGGKLTLHATDLLPNAARSLAHEVDRRLPQIPRIYVIDMMYSAARRRWYLTEINIRFGLLAQYQGPMALAFQYQVVDYLERMAVRSKRNED